MLLTRSTLSAGRFSMFPTDRPRGGADRNLLFGILALQMDFITRDQLVAAMNAWVLDKSQPLGQVLCAQGVLTAENRAWLDAGVERHIGMHGNDAQKSLAAVGSVGSVREDLKRIADSDLNATLPHLVGAESGSGDSSGADSLQTVGAGTPTSAGTRFRILRPHAKGGLGEVFVAKDEELNREIALKEIQERFADHPQNRARFLLEAEITGGLEHPGIVPVYGLGLYPDGQI